MGGSLSRRRAERALTYRVTSDNTTLMPMMNSTPIYVYGDSAHIQLKWYRHLQKTEETNVTSVGRRSSADDCTGSARWQQSGRHQMINYIYFN